MLLYGGSGRIRKDQTRGEAQRGRSSGSTIALCRCRSLSSLSYLAISSQLLPDGERMSRHNLPPCAVSPQSNVSASSFFCLLTSDVHHLHSFFPPPPFHPTTSKRWL